MQNLSKNWFLQGIATFASNVVKNTKPRVTSTNMEAATSKYYSQSYGAKMLAEFNYKCCDTLSLIPIGGLRYRRFVGDKYVEKGTTNQNLLVSRKTIDKVEGIFRT